MTDHVVEQLKKLHGESLRERVVPPLEKLLEIYPQWLRLCATEYPPVTLPIPQKAAPHAYEAAQEMLRHSPTHVSSTELDAFVVEMRRIKEVDCYGLSGIFLSALLRQLDQREYHLKGIENIRFVGYKLDNTTILADAFGDYAGAYSSNVVFAANRPDRTPAGTLVLVGKRFGDFVGECAKMILIEDGDFGGGSGVRTEQLKIRNGNFKGTTGWGSQHVVVYNGNFGSGTGRGAHHLIIYDGTFADRTGHLSRYVEIHGGTFSTRTTYCADTSVFYGGDFAHCPHQRTKEERKKQSGCTKNIEGKLVKYSTEGEIRWNVMPHT